MSATLDLEARGSRSAHGLARSADFPIPQGNFYLNAAGIGIVPRPVQDRLAQFMKALGSGGTVSYFEYYEELMTGAQDAAARLWGAPAAHVAIATSVSEAISQVAWWRRPKRGENVVMLRDDCSSATYPWIRVGQETGAEMRFAAPASGKATITFDDIARLVDRQTAAICVSHVHWVTGLKLDLLPLGELAAAHDALLIVDATHGAGVLPYAQAELDAVDMLATGSFKWLCAFAGAAPLYAGPRLLAEIEPILVGSRTSHPAPPFDEIDATRMDVPRDARLFEYGSSITLSRMAMTTSIDYILRLGLDAVSAHVRGLSGRLADRLMAAGATIVTPMDATERAGILSLSFPGHDSGEIYRALLTRNVYLSLRAGLLRFAPHIYNSDDEIDRVAEIVTSIAFP